MAKLKAKVRQRIDQKIQKIEHEIDDVIHPKKHDASKHYQSVLHYIAKHYGQNITLAHLASQAGISPYHFSRLFKQTIGQSPHQFVMAYRVEQAKKMLADLTRPMVDIAHICGFADQAHFSRVFKQIQGHTPKDWRHLQEMAK